MYLHVLWMGTCTYMYCGWGHERTCTVDGDMNVHVLWMGTCTYMYYSGWGHVRTCTVDGDMYVHVLWIVDEFPQVEELTHFVHF